MIVILQADIVYAVIFWKLNKNNIRALNYAEGIIKNEPLFLNKVYVQSG